MILKTLEIKMIVKIPEAIIKLMKELMSTLIRM